MKDKPTRCIDTVIKFCQECRYGWCSYPEWVETSDDLAGCTFESGCMYGLEDTQPTDEEVAEFEREVDRVRTEMEVNNNE